MRFPVLRLTRISMLLFAALPIALPVCVARAQGDAISSAQKPNADEPGVLDRTQASSLMPSSVFFRGQSATIQGRNSAGVRFANGKLMLAAIVDTGGYATAIAQLYQAYLITEVKLSLGGKMLSPGAYGFGFIDGDQMVVMDVGGNEVLRTPTTHDASLKRPTPLQIVPSPAEAGSYRLFLGRSYVSFSAAH